VAIIELTDVSGLGLLLPEEQNPLHTSTYGLGELILAAVTGEASQILIGIGGSATVDGGTGMLQALGVQFYDQDNRLIDGDGAHLVHIHHFEEGDLLQTLRNIPITVICDVSNPLTGPNGAAAVFAPQKGADQAMVSVLERGLTRWGRMVDVFCNDKIHEQLYTGAAGGVGMTLKAFAGAQLVPGADFVLDTLHFNQKLEWADLVITGEGLLDRQTSCLKAPFVVATRAKEYNKKVIAFAGGLKEVDYSVFDAAWSITTSPMTLEFSVKNAISLTESLSYNIGKLINELL
jgi:glycerate kinase